MMMTKVTKKVLVGAMMVPNNHPLLLLLICSLHRNFRNPVPSSAILPIMVLRVTFARLLLPPFLLMEPTTPLIHMAEAPKVLHERHIRPIVANQVVAMGRSPVPDSPCKLAVAE
jgi:hypothetical protein